MNMNTKKKFRPTKIPRYLDGEVPAGVWINDLRMYNKHRFNLFSAEAKVDAHPPKMNISKYLNRKKLEMDVQRLRRVDKENKDLLIRINTINRLGGRVDSYNPKAYVQIDTWPERNRILKTIECQNRGILKNINSVKGYYDVSEIDKEWKRTSDKIKHGCRYPVCLLQKKSIDNELKQSLSIGYLLNVKQPELRPLCFMEFSVQNGKYLGRLIIELYYDQVPVTVQNFLEICKGNNNLTYENNLVHRIVLDKYMEMGDITQCNGRGGFSIYGKTFPEENHKLRHTKAGVLSMKRVGWIENNSQFCITFKKMEELDHKNVVFGHVIKGNDILLGIQYYGRKIGKPLKNIIISKCGQYFTNNNNK